MSLTVNFPLAEAVDSPPPPPPTSVELFPFELPRKELMKDQSSAKSGVRLVFVVAIVVSDFAFLPESDDVLDEANFVVAVVVIIFVAIFSNLMSSRYWRCETASKTRSR